MTASAKAQEYVAPGPDSLSQLRGHIPMNGFTDQRVISDSRFRLSEALRSAGIQHSQAAAAAVARAHPRPHLAIHGLL